MTWETKQTLFGERVCQMHYDILATAIANYVAGLELAEIAGQDDVLLDWSKARAGEISLRAFQDKWTPYVEPIITSREQAFAVQIPRLRS